MKLIILLFLSSLTYGQQYEFINDVINPYENGNPIPKDSIYLYHQFIPLGTQYLNTESLNEESIRLWWNEIKNNQPPVELFLENFNLEHLKSDITKSQNDSIIDFNKLEKYFHKSDTKFLKENPRNTIVYISKPYFNCKKDWALIVTSSYLPYVNTSSGGLMNIYVKINGKWILYYKIQLWMS